MDFIEREFQCGKIRPEHFETRRKSGAVMSLYISMLRNCNAKDWVTGTSLDGNVIGHNAELQIHHFFPSDLLNSRGYRIDEINTFANYTIINKETNLEISNKEPILYLRNRSIKKKHLAGQCIPTHDRSLLTADYYENFLETRRHLLAKKANEYLNGR